MLTPLQHKEDTLRVIVPKTGLASLMRYLINSQSNLVEKENSSFLRIAKIKNINLPCSTFSWSTTISISSHGSVKTFRTDNYLFLSFIRDSGEYFQKLKRYLMPIIPRSTTSLTSPSSQARVLKLSPRERICLVQILLFLHKTTPPPARLFGPRCLLETSANST